MSDVGGHDHPVRRYLAAHRAAWNAGDLDGVRALLHPDLYAQSHRTLTTLGDVRGRDAHEATVSFHASAPYCDFEVVETRSDGHAAVRYLLSDGGIAELEMPCVLYVANGLLVRCATFDPGEIGAAVTMLDEWAET